MMENFRREIKNIYRYVIIFYFGSIFIIVSIETLYNFSLQNMVKIYDGKKIWDLFATGMKNEVFYRDTNSKRLGCHNINSFCINTSH